MTVEPQPKHINPSGWVSPGDFPTHAQPAPVHTIDWPTESSSEELAWIRNGKFYFVFADSRGCMVVEQRTDEGGIVYHHSHEVDWRGQWRHLSPGDERAEIERLKVENGLYASMNESLHDKIYAANRRVAELEESLHYANGRAETNIVARQASNEWLEQQLAAAQAEVKARDEWWEKLRAWCADVGRLGHVLERMDALAQPASGGEP